MLVFFTIVHVALCVFMIFVILLQPGKDAGMGSALGGGAATSAFGGRGAVTFLSKVTAGCAALFFLTSLGLSFVGMKGSVVERDEPSVATSAAPAALPAQQPGGGAGGEPTAAPEKAADAPSDSKTPTLPPPTTPSPVNPSSSGR
jgi:preprotein translocase subunit SecG